MGSYWGPHFPDAQRVAGRVYWDGHFPDGGLNPGDFAGYGPPGAATFVLDLEDGFTVTYEWPTDIIKRYGGTEQRINVDDFPKQRFAGSARLAIASVRATRGKLARYAASGAPVLLGLPYEELTLVADSASTSVFVNASYVALSDWCKIGQRVVIVGPDQSSVGAVIQSVSGGTIVLNVAPTGNTGKNGGRIMPAIAVLLDPQQGFVRPPVNEEDWNINAIAQVFDYAPTLAQLDLGAATTSAGFDGSFVTWRTFGVSGNVSTFALIYDNTAPTAGVLVETSTSVSFKFNGTTTTIAHLKTALSFSSYAMLTGTYNSSTVIAAADAFAPTFLTGGASTGDVGNGASLTTYDGRPVWDRPIQIDGSGGDSIHAMTSVLDFGGIPYSIGTADFADWGRHLRVASDQISEWQWFKKFTATTKGSQQAFWLPTYRDDFTFVSKNTNTITVSTTDGSDILAWWPLQHDRIQIKQTDGTITRAQITGVVDNLNGTATLTIGTTISGVAVERISWLELCRFEKDEFVVAWHGKGFEVTTVGRVIRQ